MEKELLLGREEVMSLARVINYIYQDENKNWLEAGSPKEGHIFNDIRALDLALNKVENI